MSDKKILTETSVANMTKEELRSFIRDVLRSELDLGGKKPVTKDEVKTIFKDMMKKHYRTFWEKSSFFLDKL
mgnify:CR=1 FL=1